jgi:hypothetical protein
MHLCFSTYIICELPSGVYTLGSGSDFSVTISYNIFSRRIHGESENDRLQIQVRIYESADSEQNTSEQLHK